MSGYILSTEDKRILDKDFEYHVPKGDQPERYAAIRKMAKVFAELVIFYSPPSRERSLALTKIEEAVFWVNASIARNE